MSVNPTVECTINSRLVEASLVHLDEQVAFWLRPRELWVGEALLAIGYEPINGGFGRAFPAVEDAEAVFRRFAGNVDEILMLKTRRHRGSWERALECVIGRLSGRTEWCLVGSAARAVRGIPVEPRDVDLVVADAAMAAEMFADLLVEPPKPMQGWVADWFGRAFHHVLIEWVAGLNDTAADRDALARRQWVPWNATTVPCSPG